jgi:hypothetical protein
LRPKTICFEEKLLFQQRGEGVNWIEHGLQLLSAIAFLFYGTACLFSQTMVGEFSRFGLSRFRVLTGALEVLGGVGLLAGFVFPLLTILASAGLTILMFMGFIVRIRIGDTWLQAAPAALLFFINLFLFVQSI